MPKRRSRRVALLLFALIAVTTGESLVFAQTLPSASGPALSSSDAGLRLPAWVTPPEADPEYQSAVNRRNAGLVVLGMFGAPGLAAMITGLAMPCNVTAGDNETRAHEQNDCAYPRLMLFGIGGGVALLSVLVGVPLTLSGHFKAKAIRERYSAWRPEVRAVALPGGAHFGASWQF